MTSTAPSTPSTTAWNRFWFTPQPTSTLALFRIAFGIVALAWTLTLAPDLGAFFSGTGILTKQPSDQAVWSVFSIVSGDTATQFAYTVLVVACVALIVGFWTRIASVLVFVGIMSFERRNPFIFNSGDGLLRLIAFYLMLTPSGLALSLDRRRAHPGRFWTFPSVPQWGLRLVQVQLSVIYLSTLWLKLRGTMWNNGTAVSYAQRIEDLVRFPTPSFVSHSLLASNLLSWGTLAIEASVPILIWNRRLRPYVIVAALALHATIELTIRVGFFSLAMMTLYISFIDPQWSAERLRVLGRRLAGRGAGAQSRLEATPTGP